MACYKRIFKPFTNINAGNHISEKKILFIPLFQESVRFLRGSRRGSNNDDYTKHLRRTLDDGSKSDNFLPEDSLASNENWSKDDDNDEQYLHKRIVRKITPLSTLPYDKQLEVKYQKTISFLRTFGQKLQSFNVPITMGKDKLPCPVDFIIPSPVTEEYRNQDEFSIGNGLDGNSKTVGYYPGNSLENPDMICLEPDELLIIKESHKLFAKDFQSYIRKSPLQANIKADDGGYWKNVSVRSNKVGEIMGVISMNTQNLSRDDLMRQKEALQEYFSSNKTYALKSLYFQACSQDQSSPKKSPYELLLGDKCITEDLNGINVQLSPGSFFSSNTQATECINNALLKLCKVKDNTTILDVFCGAGALSLQFSSLVKQCIGIDRCSLSIKDANDNAKLNNRHNVEFHQGNAEELIKSAIKSDFFTDLVVTVNPARTELSKISIKILRECKHLKKIVYISTKPITAITNFIQLCRPCGPETSLGKYFVPLMAIPVDVFPHTKHFGLIVMFQRL